MRISDGISDVCSSDLPARGGGTGRIENTASGEHRAFAGDGSNSRQQFGERDRATEMAAGLDALRDQAIDTVGQRALRLLDRADLMPDRDARVLQIGRAHV